MELTDKIERSASLFKALGHPARVAIIEKLIQQDSCVCGDFVSDLPLSQSTVSQHLKELKSVGLIKGTIEGRKVCYCIDTECYAELLEVFKSYKPICVNESNCC